MNVYYAINAEFTVHLASDASVTFLYDRRMVPQRAKEVLTKTV